MFRLLVVGFLLLSTTVQAQTRWLVVHTDTRPAPVERMRSVEEALRAEGVDVASSADAASRVETSLSLPFWLADESLRRELGVATEGVLTSVARGEDQRAIDDGLAMLERVETHLAALGRDERAGDDVANLCLFVVRAYMQRRDAGAARRQALTCLRLAPAFEPSARLHPPEVRALLDEIGPSEQGVLAVQADQASGDCLVRMQGRVVGRGTWVRRSVPPGRYEVQVECAEERAGRVHVVRVAGDSPARIDVDVTLDGAVRTDGAIALVYEDAEALRARSPEHLRRVASWVGVQRLLVHAEGTWTAYQVDPAGLTRIESFSAPEASATALARRIAAIGRPGEVRGVGVEEVTATPTTPVAAVRSRAWIAGLLVSAVGVGVGTLGWVYRGTMEDREDDFAALRSGMEEGFLTLPDEVDTARRNALLFGGLGGGVLTVGWGFLMPRRPGVPWWSWIVGAAGAGVSAWGVLETLKDGECVGPRSADDSCVVRTSPWVRGPLILGYGLPLLLTPVVYAIRNDATPGSTRASLQIAPEVGAGRVGLRVGAAF
ncbi:MAG: hypothetical protein H6724_15720 [Sandaracinus sp.]|nr:hypothetical protein [Sandaracinus sp.]